MSTALYRRYRPETFDEVIGQEHVTDPLKAAIERGRINHAYLFSGPRGCGKTTSARILARCLNCEQGPTPVPCGECPSCRDLANGGPGSLDVVEIDAASHNGVDDARDLRERAIYAPARDRYKVFILDEAHMVTSQGFNALLKIVEEPPPHIKFIFATTEPEKVIGTIRSRTHHYPFRLVPPEALGNYLEDLCNREGVNVAKGVLPLVVRAGGGSVRDTLSVLDQLIAGSGPDGVDYGRAIALLGYTPDSLLSDIVDAFSAGDGAGVYRAVERVIESGQDPRRFVEDLLERFRDLIVINAAPEAAHAFLPEVPPDRLERLTLQAAGFGQGELSRAADLLNVGLTEMSGATSPRLQLELMCARILLPGSGRSRDAVLSRVERMERRIGMSATGVAANVPPAQAPEQGQAPGQGQGSGQAQAGQGQAGQGQAPDHGKVADSRQAPDPAAGGAPTGRSGGAAAANAPAGSAQSGDHDDLDDIAAMAVAAESMLNAPAEQPQTGEPPQPAEPSPANAAEPSPRMPDPASEQTPAPESAPTSEREPIRGPEPTPAQEPASQQPGPNTQPAESDAQPTEVGQAGPRDQNAAAPTTPQRNDAPRAERSSMHEQSTSAPQAPETRREQSGSEPARQQPASEPAREQSPPEAASVAGPGDIGGEIEAIRRAWPSILAAVEKRSRLTRAIIAANAIPQSFSEGTVYLGFNNPGSVQGFQQRDHAAKLAAAINDVLGIQARIDIGDVGRIGGNAAGGNPQGKGASAPPMNDGGGNHGPAPSQRRPTPQEVAAVVGTREVDKPQVDHEKFWEPSGPTQGPWSSDDEEGDQPGPPNQPTTENGHSDHPDQGHTAEPPAPASTGADRDDEPTPHGDVVESTPSGDAAEPEPQAEPVAATEPEAATAGPGSESTSDGPEPGSPNDASASEAATPEIVVPDLSDDDFFGAPADEAPDSAGDTGRSEAPRPSFATEHASEPDDQQVSSGDQGSPSGAREQSAGDDYAPMEYVEPRWDEPNWNDGPGPLNDGPADVDSTSAGSGAVDVGAVVVPPPDDDLDYPDFTETSDDFGTGASAPSEHSAPISPSGPGQSRTNDAKPFKSRFAALAAKHGVTTTPSSGSGFGSSAPPNGGGDAGPGNASVPVDSYPQNSGPDEDYYDPETDLDVSEAPQIGVDVIARVLGGEIIDEREV
ncbi:DNA polymerase III subunit gamma and tau [Brevibacterium spongiae]|uniref:DNA-directed DNA polymerase n=1 Tax=Brevibacterium spongiae TaxID=2909672 RepID=A0ABY5SR09_9MICO|nr:DNA polymerase III subunit gamma and tau [Brevibacterium spongiae]UVI37005.1 DNA polymerase III subunit gamma and tau [Brevibacterium spongiae]